MPDESGTAPVATAGPAGLGDLLEPADLRRLASGVAHDLNNILGPVVVYPDLVREELTARFGLAPDDPVCEDLQLIENAALQAAAVIQDLLALTGQGPRNLATVDPAAAVDEVLCGEVMEVLGARCPGVRVRVVKPLVVPHVHFLQARLPRLVENLLGFAMGGTPEGGEVVIELAPVIGRGEWVDLLIRDGGLRLGKEESERLFEPFFARRRLGRSVSGLAMSVARALVLESGGDISVLPGAPGAGTVLRVRLAAAKSATVIERDTAALRGSEVVLLVDDEPAQRALFRRLMEGLGYTVHTAASGREALDWLARERADIVVLDMILGDGFDGLDTWRAIVQTYPKQKGIIASGFSQSARVEAAIALGVGDFVEKPYTRERLARALRGVIDVAAQR